MSGPQQAYNQIIRPIEDRMIGSIWRIVRNAQDAEDALQDALLIVWKRWDYVVSHPAPQSLVLKICIDAAYDLTRRSIRRQSVTLSANRSEKASSSPAPSDELAAEELHTEIIKAIHRLSRQQAQAMLMHVVQGQRYDEVAAAMGCTEATVRKHIARSRQRLRIWLAHLDPAKARSG
jgi:RNA polymerase sigma-70 factor, ECF subfamily